MTVFLGDGSHLPTRSGYVRVVLLWAIVTCLTPSCVGRSCRPGRPSLPSLRYSYAEPRQKSGWVYVAGLWCRAYEDQTNLRAEIVGRSELTSERARAAVVSWISATFALECDVAVVRMEVESDHSGATGLGSDGHVVHFKQMWRGVVIEKDSLACIGVARNGNIVVLWADVCLLNVSVVESTDSRIIDEASAARIMQSKGFPASVGDIALAYVDAPGAAFGSLLEPYWMWRRCGVDARTSRFQDLIR